MLELICYAYLEGRDRPINMIYENEDAGSSLGTALLLSSIESDYESMYAADDKLLGVNNRKRQGLFKMIKDRPYEEVKEALGRFPILAKEHGLSKSMRKTVWKEIEQRLLRRDST